MSSVGPINHIIQSVHNEVQQFADAASQGGGSISSSQAERFIETIQQKTEALQHEARGDFQAKAEGLDGKTLNRLSHAIASLGANSALARQLAKPSQHANLGNVLLSLGETIEKMKRKRQKVIFKKKGLKVEKFEIVEFLNSTEKEFKRFVAAIQEKEADEDLLYKFIKELTKRMEILKYLHKISMEKQAKRLVDSKHYKKLLDVINKISEDEMIRKKIYEISIDGETGMTHLRFWKTLKQMADILDEL